MLCSRHSLWHNRQINSRNTIATMNSSNSITINSRFAKNSTATFNIKRIKLITTTCHYCFVIIIRWMNCQKQLHNTIATIDILQGIKIRTRIIIFFTIPNIYITGTDSIIHLICRIVFANNTVGIKHKTECTTR